MTITFRHYLLIVCSYAIGLWAFLDSSNSFGAFALVFIPALCMLLVIGLARGWLKADWL